MSSTFDQYLSSLSYLTKHRIRFALIFFAVIGFSVQVIQVSILYFEYETTTQVKMRLHDFLIQHNIQICIRYGDILDRDRLLNETGKNVVQILDLDEAIDEESTLTLKQMFDYTPSAAEVISACFYRSSDMTFGIQREHNCSSLFKVTKAFTLEFMCYKFDPISQFRLPMSAAVQSRYKQYTIFDITLNQQMQTANYIVPVAFIGSYPYESRRFSESALIHSNLGHGHGDYNWINVFSNDFIINQLEAPYDTRCISREYDEYFVCHRDCLVSGFRRRFHKLPFTEFLEEGGRFNQNHKFLSTAELNDPVTGKRVREMYIGCKKRCYFNPCYMIYTKTTFRTLLFKEFPLAFSAMTPTEADIVTQAQVTMTFVEYFSFITGCFGTWFGLSFMSLDPLHYSLRMRRRQMTNAPAAGNLRQVRQPFFRVREDIGSSCNLHGRNVIDQIPR